MVVNNEAIARQLLKLPLTIMVVNSEAIARQLLKTTLHHHGCEQ